MWEQDRSVDVCVCAHTCVHTWVKRSEEGIKWPLTVGSPSEPGAHDFSEDGSRWTPAILSLPLSGLGLQACMGPRLTFHTGAWSKHSTSVLSHQAQNSCVINAFARWRKWYGTSNHGPHLKITLLAQLDNKSFSTLEMLKAGDFQEQGFSSLLWETGKSKHRETVHGSSRRW